MVMPYLKKIKKTVLQVCQVSMTTAADSTKAGSIWQVYGTTWDNYRIQETFNTQLPCVIIHITDDDDDDDVNTSYSSCTYEVI